VNEFVKQLFGSLMVNVRFNRSAREIKPSTNPIGLLRERERERERERVHVCVKTKVGRSRRGVSLMPSGHMTVYTVREDACM